MPRNAKRNFVATEYRPAPRNRLGAQEVAVAAATTVDITALCPTFAQVGEAPFFDLLVGFNPNVITLGLVGVCVTDDPAIVSITYPYTGEEETEGIRVRGLFPFAAAGALPATQASQGLVTPLVVNQALGQDAINNRRLNHVFLVNDQAQGDVDLQIVFEIPTLDWE